jgi:hypothetical protein
MFRTSIRFNCKEFVMAISLSERMSSETAAYGGFVDAIGGVATIVLAVIGLAGVKPEMMVSIATIVFGVALLVEGGTMLSEYARIIFPSGARSDAIENFGGIGLSAHFLVGAAGIVLGVLALLGIASVTLTSVALIAFGAAMILSSNSVWKLHQMKRSAMLPAEGQPVSGTAILANEMASESAGALTLAGLAAIVLGILAVAGMNPIVLTLAALIALGATMVLTGSSLSATVVSFMRPAEQR